MKTFYSILYSPIRPIINEQISIGLILVGQKDILFRFSLSKLKILKHMLSQETTMLIKHYLDGLDKKIQELAQTRIKNDSFFQTNEDHSSFSIEYISKLSVYNNNMVIFSEPKSINIDVTQENFNYLFQKFVSEELTNEVSIHRLDRFLHLKSEFFPKVKQRVNTEVPSWMIKIPQVSIPQSIIPETIHLIGKNDRYISGQFIDFKKNEYNLRDDLSRYLNFVNELNHQSKSFVIGTEPSESHSKQFRFWKDMREYNKIQLVPSSELARIEEYLSEHDVHPLPTAELSE